MSNLIETVALKIKNSRIVLWVFLAALTMLGVGLNHFYEDTLSSRYGIEWLERVFGLHAVSHPLTYWTMSVAPQIATIVFGYIFITNTKNKTMFWAIVVAFLIDFTSDIWYRSNERLLASPGTFLAAVFFTFAWFTVGSEVFVTVGASLVFELFPSFLEQSILFVAEAVGGLSKGMLMGRRLLDHHWSVNQPPAYMQPPYQTHKSAPPPPAYRPPSPPLNVNRPTGGSMYQPQQKKK